MLLLLRYNVNRQTNKQSFWEVEQSNSQFVGKMKMKAKTKKKKMKKKNCLHNLKNFPGHPNK